MPPAGSLGDEATSQVGAYDRRAEQSDWAELCSFNRFPISSYMARRLETPHAEAAVLKQRADPINILHAAPMDYDLLNDLQFPEIATEAARTQNECCSKRSTPVFDTGHPQHKTPQPSGSVFNGNTRVPPPVGMVTERNCSLARRITVPERQIHRCSFCEARFRVHRDLLRHITCVHRGCKIACPDCGKRFSNRPDNLIRHLRMHCKGKGE